jgi:Ca2+/H+ antiporter
MALTFDEFGMWLHLGGSYWQRVSIDAVVVVAAVLGLIAFASTLKRLEAKHMWAFISLTVALIIFAFILITAGDKLGDIVGPELHDLEVSSSP